MRNSKIGFTIISFLFLSSLLMGSTHPIVPDKGKELANALIKWSKQNGFEEDVPAPKSFQFDAVNELIKIAVINEEADDMTDIYRKREEYYGNPKVQKAKMFIDGLQAGKLLSVLTGADLVKMPIGFKKNFNGYTVSVVFASAKLYPEYASLTVYGGVQKEGGEELLFGSDNIKFSYEGGIIGDGTLGLLADYPIKREGKKLAFLFKGFERAADGNHRGTYMTIDCNGFVEAKVDGDVIISRDWVIPTDAEGRIIKGNSRVRANIAVTVTDWSDMVAEASFPNFTLARDTSVAFVVDQAIVDFSDVKNGMNFFPPPEINLETGELEHQYDDETAALWKGVYFRKIEVILPQVFDQTEGSLTFGAESLYFDSRGVTGRIYGDNVLPIEKGQLGKTGWAFGIDRLDMVLVYSQIFEFGFNGRMSIPISGEKQALAYGANATPSTETYNFNLGVDSVMQFPMMKAAYVKLNKASTINVRVEKKEFDAQANLSGIMEISTVASKENENTNLNIADIKFEKLLVDTKAPYILLAEGGSISFQQNPLLNNSRLNIDHATLQSLSDNEVMFTMGVSANVMDEDSGGGKTGGDLGIVGKLYRDNGKYHWEYDRMKLVSLSIDVVFGTYAYINGGIEFFSKHPIYGDGFKGNLNGGFILDKTRTGNKAGPDGYYQLNVAANARFGTMFKGEDNEYKYWSFDVYVSSDTYSVPIYKPIEANGFGGGMYHHMRMHSFDIKEMAIDTDSPFSGIEYRPDPEILLGVKISLGIVLTKVDGFKANVTLEMAIDNNYALQDIMFYGNGEFVSDQFNLSALDNIPGLTKTREVALTDNLAKAEKDKQDKITAAVMLHVNLTSGLELHGSFGVFLDAAGGKISGGGTADLYFSSAPIGSGTTPKWHIYIGGYQGVKDYEGNDIKPFEVSLNFESFSYRAGFYLVTGNDLPAPPGIKPQVAQFLKIPSNLNNRNLLESGGRSAATGSAFAMGAGIELSFVKEKILRILDVKLEGSSGFDLALLSNSSNSYCSDSTVRPQGVKGWRAQGNIYGYFIAEVYRRRGKKAPKSMGKINVGAIVIGDVPRPSSFYAKVKFEFLIWDIGFDQSIGDDCGQVILN